MIVSGSVTTLSTIETASQTNPHSRVRGPRMNQWIAGSHFIQVASAHRRPPSRGPENWAPHSMSVSSRLMLPVSRLAPNGNPRIAMMTAVVSGRRR